jgi:DNA (cytosine-5)-methyltransferase 1
MSTAVDLFCGAGGASLGMLEAGWDVRVAIDKADSALETHAHNLAGDVVQHDLGKVDADLLPDDLDYLHASPPCKGFSTAGQMDSDDERNELVWTTLDWIDAAEPDVATIENVPELVNGTRDQRLRSRLRELGYTHTWGVLDAAKYGVPQHRRRLFVVAVHESVDSSPSLPAPIHGPRGQQSLTGRALEPWRTVGNALRETATDGGTTVPNAETPDHRDDITARYEDLQPGETSDETAKDSEMRLDPSKPSPCLTTQPRDFVHPYEPRSLSVRDMARLQSFPDWFEFKGRRTTGGTNRGEDVCQAEQVGNAVPPRLQEAVASHVRTEVIG